MVHKKYTYKNGKKFGPYYYETKRVNGKVVTTYLGSKPPGSRKVSGKKLLIPFVFFALFGVLLLSFFFIQGFTGKAVLNIDAVFNPGDLITGNLNLKIKSGELIPENSDVFVRYNDREYKFLLSDLLSEEQVYGDFYAEGVSLEGVGKGYGLAGVKKEYPEVYFKLRIVNSGADSFEESFAEEPDLEVNSNESNETTSNETTDVDDWIPGDSSDFESNGTNSKETIENETVEVEANESYVDDELEDFKEEELEGENVEPSDSLVDEPVDVVSSPGITGAVVSGSEFVSGRVSKGNDFVYEFEEGKAARLVKGSVGVKDKEIGDDNVKLENRKDKVVVSTEYFDGEEGFGEDYLGEDYLELSIKLNEFDLIAVEDGVLEIIIVSQEKEIVSTSGNINVIGELNQTENNTLVEDTNVTLNETQEIEERNFTINPRVNVTQFGAVLGQPVKWKTRVDIEGPASVRVEIPASAENVSIVKLNKTDSGVVSSGSEIEEVVEEEMQGPLEEDSVDFVSPGITGLVTAQLETGGFVEWFRKLFRITGRAIDENSKGILIDIEDNEKGAEIDYITQAPAISFEEEIDNGKRVGITGPDDVHYQDVLIFTELNESLEISKKSAVKIYWVENDTYLSPWSVQDKDDNGIFDYVEFVAPHLSNQTFEIIVIIGAEHLDSNRNFLSDIYEDVKELDGNWSESILENEYVRVTFEKNLTYENDITVYPRIMNGTPRIEVYEFNDTEIIARFDDLKENEYNKVYLTNLSNRTQDVFDLRVVNGILEFDHIIDPTLINVSDYPSSVNNVTIENNFSHLTVDSSNSPYDSLMLYLPFDINNTDAEEVHDYSVNDIQSIIYGDAHFEENGLYGGYYNFDGTVDRIGLTDGKEVDSFSSSDAFTVSVWFRTSQVNTNKVLVGDYTGSGNIGWLVYVDASDRAAFLVRNGGNTAFCRYTGAVDGNWHFYLAAYDGSGGTSCQLDSNQKLGGTVGYNFDNGGTVGVSIGSNNNGTGTNGWVDDIDEVMIFNSTLTSQEATDLYQNSSARFYGRGEQVFENIDASSDGEDTFNVSISQILNFDNVNFTLSVAEGGSGDYSYGQEYDLSSGSTTNLNFSSVENISLKVNFYSDTNNFYTPILNGSITIDSWRRGLLSDCAVLDVEGTNYDLVDDLVSSTTCLNVTADNIRIDGKGFSINGSDTAGSYGITAFNVTNLTITDIVVRNYEYGVYLFSNISNVGIDNSSFLSTTDAGLNFEDVNNSYVGNNTISDNDAIGFSFNGVESSKDLDLLENEFYNNGADSISIVGATGTVSENVVDSSTGDGIYISSVATSVSKVVSSYNNISNSGDRGIFCSSALSNCTLLDNKVILSDTGGVQITGSGYVGSNTIANNSGYGIRISAGSTVIAGVSNNYIYNSTKGIFGQDSLGTGIRDIYFSNNRLDENNNSLYFTSTFRISDHLFVNNTFANSTGDAIYLSGGTIDNLNFTNFTVTGTNNSNFDFRAISSGIDGLKFTSAYLENYTFAGSSDVRFFDDIYGEIFFLNSISGSGTNLSNDVRIGNNSAVVESDTNSGLNQSANITFYGIGDRGFSSPQILRDGSACNSGTNPSCYNFTNLDATNVIFNVSSWTEYSIGDDAGNPPNNPSPDVNSTLGTNLTLQDLNCFATITDPDSDTLDVTVEWYNNSVKHLTLDYNNSYASGTEFEASLDSANTTKGEQWSCGMRLYDGSDYSDWVNSTGSVTILNTPPPAPSLSSPSDGASTTDRTPTFIWTQDSPDADGDSLTYVLNISCYNLAGGSCSGKGDDSRLIGGLGTSHEISSDLLYLIDNNNYYNWTVIAYDGESNSTSWPVQRRLNISSLVEVSLPNSTVEFGFINYQSTNDTSDDSPNPFLLQNDGNVFVNVTIEATDLWNSQANPSEYYQFKVDNYTLEPYSFDWVSSITSYTNMPSASTLAIALLNYTNATDTVEIDINITVPLNEPADDRESTVTFTGSLSE